MRFHLRKKDEDEISPTIIHESAAGRKSGYAPGRKGRAKAEEGAKLDQEGSEGVIKWKHVELD